jgi:hypothetical protein
MKMVLSYRIETLHILAWIVFISIVEKIFRAIKMDITRLQSLLSKGDNPFQYVGGGGGGGGGGGNQSIDLEACAPLNFVVFHKRLYQTISGGYKFSF